MLLLPLVVEEGHRARVSDDEFRRAVVASFYHAAVSDDVGDGLVVAVPDGGAGGARHRKTAVFLPKGA